MHPAQRTYTTGRIARHLAAACLMISLPSLAAAQSANSSACQFTQPAGSCTVAADVSTSGLSLRTNGGSCSSVDYRVNGVQRRIFLQNGTGSDSNVATGSSVDVISCTSYAAGTTTVVAPPATQAVVAPPATGTVRQVGTQRVTVPVSLNVPVYERRVVERQIVRVDRPVYVDRPVVQTVVRNQPVYVDRPVVQTVVRNVDRPVYIDRPVPQPVIQRVIQPVPQPVPVHVPYYIRPQVQVSYGQAVPGVPQSIRGGIPGYYQQFYNPAPFYGFGGQPVSSTTNGN